MKDADGSVIKTLVTDADGNYVFEDVPQGSYTLEQIAPPGFAPVSAAPVGVNVPENGAAVASFGNLRAGTVSGTVFNDINGNGVQDAGEKGIPGVTVELKDVFGNVVKTALTDADGNYVFSNLPPGSYTLTQGENIVPANVAGGAAATANFAVIQQTGTVSGRVFNDLNENGIQDADESGIPGIRVELRDSSGNLIATAVTGDDGAYLFSNVKEGNYTVSEQDPEGAVSTTANTVSVAIRGAGPALADFGDCMDCETEPTEYLPPTAYKTVSGDRPILEWEMVWTNRDNSEGLLVHIEVPLPDELTYIEGSLGADYGNFWYDKDRHTIVWEGIIPGNGGTVKIGYETAVSDDADHVENQACAVWDRNGNGEWEDEAASSEQISVCTDNPDSSDAGDATGWTAPEPHKPDKLMKPF